MKFILYLNMHDGLIIFENPFVLVSGLILLLAFLFYFRYRLKSRIASALEKEIKEHKQTAERLKESEEKFRILAEKSTLGICITQKNTIKYANPKLLEILAYPQEEMIGKHCLDLVFAQDRSMMKEKLTRGLTEIGDTISCEFRGLTKNKEVIYLECFASFILYQGQPAIFETIIDITQRKKAESELIKSRKMESVGILAGGIAHDFNNLLSIILGNVSMLKMKLGKKDLEIYAFLEKVEQASAQAAELAHQFVVFSEEGGLLRKKVTLANILKNTLELSPETRHISSHIDIPPDLDPIYGDERQLRQVITNLLINAHEAAPDENEQITIKAENVSLEQTNPFSLAKGNYVKISVIDTGKGIPPDLLETIFDPYFSTKSTVTQKGLGMGLAICYSIIKKHEGRISITSEEGKGATVEVYLPVYE
ncbi:MAG: PAS domain S-box protein [Candidatus Aminicenantes bacterium]|nr:MAG: PAS domain S-box protein [Candidatus Aminicenantes bacterium]